MQLPGLSQIAGAFIRFGNLTLGGGSATIAVLHREIVERRTWVREDQFSLSFAMSRLTPGTNLLAFSTGIGWMLRGWSGAVAALLASSIPCTVIVIAVTAAFGRLEGNNWVQAALHGAVAAAVGITVKTCWTLTGPHFKHGQRLRVALIGASAFCLNAFLGMAPVQVLLLSAVMGLFLPEPKA